VPRRGVRVLALAAVLSALGLRSVWAHAGLRLTDPVEGATLGDTPHYVRLSFSERPEPSLSDIRVLDIRGNAVHAGRPTADSSDPLTLIVPIRPLDRGVYVVTWRIVSAVDGHSTNGSYAFGVRVDPTNTTTASNVNAAASRYEMVARAVLIVGLVVLLGAACAGAAPFGGSRELAPGMIGWVVAMAGVVLLADAQRRGAGASFADLSKTSVGRALVGRGAATALAGAALLGSRWALPSLRRLAITVAMLAALAAMAVHVSAGHAAAGTGWVPAAAISAQWAHFAGVGIWLGGLASLMFGIRGAPSTAKTDAVRRFSTIASAGLFVVAATGVGRAAGELSAWDQLIATAYGRALLAKIAVLAAIATLGAVNHWRSVAAASTNLRPLRRLGTGELALAAGAVAVAAVLGTLPPPSSAAPLGFAETATDFGTTVRVEMTSGSAQPGPNRFVIRASDYDSKAVVQAQRVSLRFTPIDDPGIASSLLSLSLGADGAWIGSDANITFDGRWRITALIERNGDSVEVPMEVETRRAAQRFAIQRRPARATQYTVWLPGEGAITFSLDPEGAGRTRLTVSCLDQIEDRRPITTIVVTVAAGTGPARQVSVQREDMGRFAGDVELARGKNRLTGVAWAADGTRLRAALEVEIPEP